jgi:predicted nuclease of restriction endonuclease-like (RecB) superfamily
MIKSKEKMLKVKTTTPTAITSESYRVFVEEIKERILTSQIKASMSVNAELIKLYWSIGKDLTERQKLKGWGTKIIEKFAQDIQNAFPGIEGFSIRNIFRMRALYQRYLIVAQAVSQLEDLPIFNIPWGHNIVLLQRLKDPETRLWYASKTLANGWSRNILEKWIEAGLHKREGKAITNFKNTLPEPLSDLAEQTIKNPYNLDFLTLGEKAKEKEIESALVTHIREFLLELGEGFAFVGSQVPIIVDGETYLIDMLFYNYKLSMFFVCEIKARDFDPRDTGQINFYLSAVDSQIKRQHDQPSVGILLYYTKKKQRRVKIEYALRHVRSSLAVTTILVKSLPKQLKGTLPSVQEFEEEIEHGIKTIESQDETSK